MRFMTRHDAHSVLYIPCKYHQFMYIVYITYTHSHALSAIEFSFPIIIFIVIVIFLCLRTVFLVVVFSFLNVNRQPFHTQSYYKGQCHNIFTFHNQKSKCTIKRWGRKTDFRVDTAGIQLKIST